MPFELPPLPDDPDDITNRLLDGLAANPQLEGWEPVEGDPLVALAEELGREGAVTNARAALAILTAVAGIGETVFGLQVITATTATLTATLTVSRVGAVIPASFTVYGTNPSGETIAFVLPSEVTATTLDQAVTLTAALPGAAANGVTGDLVVGTATAEVVSATTDWSSAGGIDAETVVDYTARFADYAAILRPGGVRGRDLATLARSVPGVFRALGIDLYDADTDTYDVERTATIVPIDENGLPVGPSIAAAVAAALADVREVNFVIRTAEPTYTPVDVTYTAVAETGYEAAVVEANVDAAVAAWLSPSRWGNADGSTAAEVTIDADEVWDETLTVRYLDLARVAGTAEGVAYLSGLTLDGGTVDVTLDGPAGLPSPVTNPPAGVTASTVSGTVS